MEDLNLEELNLDTIDEKGTQEIAAAEEEKRRLEEEKLRGATTDPLLGQYVLDDGGALPPPFPELRSLSMAYNKV